MKQRAGNGTAGERQRPHALAHFTGEQHEEVDRREKYQAELHRRWYRRRRIKTQRTENRTDDDAGERETDEIAHALDGWHLLQARHAHHPRCHGNEVCGDVIAPARMRGVAHHRHDGDAHRQKAHIGQHHRQQHRHPGCADHPHIDHDELAGQRPDGEGRNHDGPHRHCGGAGKRAKPEVVGGDDGNRRAEGFARAAPERHRLHAHRKTLSSGQARNRRTIGARTAICPRPAAWRRGCHPTTTR